MGIRGLRCKCIRCMEVRTKTHNIQNAQLVVRHIEGELKYELEEKKNNKLNGYNNKLNGYNNKLNGYNNKLYKFINKLFRYDNTLEECNNKLNEYRNKLDKYQNRLDEFRNKPHEYKCGINDKKFTDEYSNSKNYFISIEGCTCNTTFKMFPFKHLLRCLIPSRYRVKDNTLEIPKDIRQSYRQCDSYDKWTM